MQRRLEQYFVPLYLENDEAEAVLRAGGREPYAPDEWQLVQTHILSAAGEVEELWRPGANSGPDDALVLAAALDGVIARRGLSAGSPLPRHRAPREEVIERGGLLMRVVQRFPVQPNLTRQRNLSIDWISVSADDLDQLRPPPGGGQAPWTVSEELAARILIHLRPPLDTAEDLDETALEMVHDVEMRAVVMDRVDGVVRVAVAGGLSLVRPAWWGPVHVEMDRWTALRGAHIEAEGVVSFDESTGAVTDALLRATRATLVPPDRGEVTYHVSARRFNPGAP